ncbi:MAG: MBOAT family protein [Proteocatella sp.]
MLFSSIIFLFYFLPVTMILYYALKFSRPLQNIVLLGLSLFFYSWGEPKFVAIMVLSVIMNYIFGILVDRHRKDSFKSKLILTSMCIYNVGVLFIFKYMNFVIRNLNSATDINLPVTNIVLPIGISFFTFQAMSYVIDVYRQDASVQKNPFYLGLYISFFPQLIAGPIVRYQTVDRQIREREETWKKFSVGMCRFVTGLGKKILIANNMAIIADYIYVMNGQGYIPVSLAWLGSIAYTFQIFFDFSAYSDMAIGLGLMFGFKFDENFNYPYISKSISEFWRRWHISLGSWFRSYVYFPLGGSRVANKDRVVRNLFIVWLLTGIWHGAEWTFLIWGLLNFTFIVFEKLFMVEKSEKYGTLKHIYTLLAVNFGWVVFRSQNIVEAGRYFKSMFGASGFFWSDYTYMFIKEYWIFFIGAVIFSMPFARRANLNIAADDKFSAVFRAFYPVAMAALFMICVTYLVKGSYNPFIYFNF